MAGAGARNRPQRQAGGDLTLALLQAPSELNELKRYVENGEFLFEANDLGAVNMAAERGLPFVAGHALNCYNAYTLRLRRRA